MDEKPLISKLVFHVTLVDGTQVDQEFSVPAAREGQEAVVKAAMVQYATVGFLKKDGDNYHLILSSQIKEVKCSLSSIALADLSQMSRLVTP